jgi:predicted kinase
MKRAIIYIGISGSGKSTHAKKTPSVMCSADKYFEDSEGGYRFDPAHLRYAHETCLRTFLYSVQTNEAIVTVDNTNTTVEEIAPYVALAEAHGYEVKIFAIECHVARAHARNTHGIPFDVVARQLVQIQSLRENWPSRWPVPTVIRT